MARSTEQIENEMLALSHEERACLAHKLIVSLDEGVREDVEDYWKEELVRRDRQIEASGIRISIETFNSIKREKS